MYVYLYLSYPILSYPTLSYPTLPYPTLPYPTLSYPILSYPILSYLSVCLSVCLYIYIYIHMSKSRARTNILHVSTRGQKFSVWVHLQTQRFFHLRRAEVNLKSFGAPSND